jgi:hypothetical protein
MDEELVIPEHHKCYTVVHKDGGRNGIIFTATPDELKMLRAKLKLSETDLIEEISRESFESLWYMVPW